MNSFWNLLISHSFEIIILVSAVVGAIAKNRGEAAKKIEDEKVRSAPLPTMEAQNPLESQTKKGESPWGNDSKGPFDSQTK